jgi:deoxycytidylate deaminase
MTPPIEVIKIAIGASRRSVCLSQRGTVIWRDDIVVSAGHNYKPPPFKCDQSAECKRNCGKDAVHAEQAAIISSTSSLHGCSMLHVKTVDGILVPSMGPSCLQCSKLILAAGITWMWLYHHVNSDRPEGWKRYSAAEFHYLSGAYEPVSYT